MKRYIGCKIIKAELMGKKEFFMMERLKQIPQWQDEPGYKVVYPDGYVSWSPKDVFESAYREFTDGEAKLLYG